MNRTRDTAWRTCGCAGTYSSMFRFTLLLSLFCLHMSIGSTQTAQPTPKPASSPAPRRPLPRLSSGARGFDFAKGSKDASTRLIAVGGGWGGEPEKKPRLRGQTAKAYYDLGNKFLEQTEFSKAIPPLARAVKLNPNYLAAYKALGEAYAYDGVTSIDEIKDEDRAGKFQQTRYRQAIGAFEQARRLAPGNPGLHFNLGILYFNTGEYEKSMAAFQTGFRLKPKGGENQASLIEGGVLRDSDIYAFIGDAFEHLGQRENAVTFYQKALEVNPDVDKTDIYEKLGGVYQELGESDKALAAYQKAISKNRPDELIVELLLHIGEIYAAKQSYGEAAAAFAKVIEIYEERLKYCKQMLAARVDETVDERKYWQKESARLQTDSAQAHYNLGVARLSLNQTEGAVESFKQVVVLDGKNANARFNLGVAYLALGNKEGAREQVRLLKAVDLELARELEELINR
jgi:tetratricopeptide (TPR) repeat protein